MSLHFAPGLDWSLLIPQIAIALTVASECYAEEGEDCYVSGLTRRIKGATPEQAFRVHGFHSTGAAADLAVKRYRGGVLIPQDKMDRIYARLESRLGRSGGSPFDVLDERNPRPDSPGWSGPHIHLEFQPY